MRTRYNAAGKRRGAITIMTALLFMSMMVCWALVTDFSRLWTTRNELQTAADAAALAGGLQLIGGRDTLRISDSAIAFAHRNRALADTIHVDWVQKGNWDNATRTFTAAGAPTNAVQVEVSYNPSHIVMRGLGATVPRMRAQAVSWASAPVANPPTCMMPWAIPYEHLMFAINSFRGITNTTANLTRPFDQVADMAALNSMTAGQRTFSLKVGSSTGGLNQAAATVANMPGNFQAVRLPKYWDYGTQTYSSPGPLNGANEYRNWINGSGGCSTLAVGDSLQTQTGNMVGPTEQGVREGPNYVCSSLTDNNGSNMATHGDCVQADGSIGRDIISAFFSCEMSGCNGLSKVAIKLTGSFTLMKVYPDNDGGPPASRRYEQSQIVGVFKPLQTGGAGGGGSTTLTKLVLAK